MIELIAGLTFIERGILAGVIIAFICPIIGAFLLVRRVSIMSESLSHITLTGISAGVLLSSLSIFSLNINPMYVGVIFALLGSLLIEKLRGLYHHFEELAVPIILSAGVGLSAILISVARSGYSEWYQYLFGSIVSVTRDDVAFILASAIVVLILVSFFYKEFVSISFDPEYARVSGIAVKRMNVIFALLIALAISMSMKVVGILLVGAMVVLPTAASIHIAKSFKQVIGIGILFAQAAMLTGIYFSYHLNIATGGMVVFIAVVGLVVIIAGKKVFGRMIRRESIERN